MSAYPFCAPPKLVYAQFSATKLPNSMLYLAWFGPAEVNVGGYRNY
jgi:hypothetical protein